MSYATTIIARSNLLAYWQCGEASGTTFADTSGNSLDLTITGSPTLGATGSGAGGTAVTFNGSSQYASRASSVVGNSPSAFAIEFMVKGTFSTASKYIFGLSRSSSSTPFILLGVGNGYSNSFGPDTRNDASAKAYTIASATVAVNDGSWHHVTVNFSADSCKIYVDGVLAYAAARSAALGTTTLDITSIGAIMLSGSASNHIAATMQHVAVFSRVLTLAEIYADVTAAGLTPPASGGIIRTGMDGGML